MPKEKSSGKSKENRTKYFTAILYPDSDNTPENWIDVLSETHVPVFISPLHDKDLNLTGESKKPHYHLIVAYDSLKSCEQARTFFSAVGAVCHPCDDKFKVQSIRGAVRYLCHLDNPEKAQYDEKNVRCLSGADYAGVIQLVTDKYKAIGEMKDFCERYDIVSFYLLDRYAQNFRPDWARVLADTSTLHIKEWLQSRKWSRENNYMQIIDPETGEVAFDFRSEHYC